MNIREPQDAARVLADAARTLGSNNQWPAALTAALMSRIKASEGLLDERRMMLIDSSRLSVKDGEATYPEVLGQVTSALSSSHSNAGQALEYASTIENIDMPDQPVVLEDCHSTTPDPGIFSQLAQRLADDGLALEAGRALTSATIAMWHRTHQEANPAVPAGLIQQITEAIVGNLDINLEWAGHGEVWERLQAVRFTPQETPAVL